MHGYSSLMFLVCCVGSGLCKDLSTRSEESYRMCVSMCDLGTSTVRWLRPELGCSAREKKIAFSIT